MNTNDAVRQLNAEQAAENAEEASDQAKDYEVESLVMFIVSVATILTASFVFGYMMNKNQKRKLKPLELFARLEPSLVEELALSNSQFPDKLSNSVSSLWNDKKLAQFPQEEFKLDYPDRSVEDSIYVANSEDRMIP